VFILDSLARLVATGGPLALATLDLEQDTQAWDTVTLADLVAGKATYTGYVQGVITWLAPSVADDGTPEIVGTIPEFRPTDSVTPNTIYGVYILNAGGTKVYFAGPMNSGPVPMGGVLDSLLITLRIRVTAQGLLVVTS
jgi:hypothetical protein